MKRKRSERIQNKQQKKYYENILRKKIYNKNVFKNANLRKMYKPGDKIVFFRTSTNISNQQFVQLANKETLQYLPQCKQSNAICLINTLAFLDLYSYSAKLSALARKRQRNPDKKKETGTTYSPHNGFYWNFVVLSFNNLKAVLEKIPIGYGIRVQTVDGLPYQHAFVIYKFAENTIRIMMHLTNQTPCNGRKDKTISLPDNSNKILGYLSNKQMVNPADPMLKVFFLVKL
jgi:hypothetical protein